MKDLYTHDRRYRFCYDPVWSPAKPWCVFFCGSAESQFPTLIEALRYAGVTIQECFQ